MSRAAGRIKQLRSEALQLAQNGEHSRALERFAQLEKLDPNEADWPRRAADCHRLLGDRSEQLRALGRAADGYMGAGMVVKAMAICKIMLALDPQHAAALTWLSKVERPLGLPTTGFKGEALPSAGDRPPSNVHAKTSPARPSSRAPSLPEAPPTPARKLAEARGLVAVARLALRESGRRRPPVPDEVHEPEGPPSTSSRQSRGLPSSGGWQIVDEAELLEPETPPPRLLSLPPLRTDNDLHKLVPGSGALRVKGAPSGMFRLAIDPPPPAHGDRAMEQAREVLPAVPVFSELDPRSLAELIRQSRLIHLEPGEVVFRQDDAPDCFYVIVNGSVAVVDEAASNQELYRLRENEFFGEAALLSNELRPATVRALDGCDLMAFNRESMRACIEGNPSVVPILLRFLRGRMIEHLVHTSPLFTIFDTADRRALSRRFEFIEPTEGAQLIEQGEPSPGLFVLLSGAADVIFREDGKEYWLATLERGGVFGEISLLNHAPAMASVTSVTPGFALMLPAVAFREVILTYPPFLDLLSTLSDERERANKKTLRRL